MYHSRIKETLHEIEWSEDGSVILRNPNISKMEEDVLYHLSIGTGSHDLKEMFSDVKFVCMGGTPRRMEHFAHYIQEELNVKLPAGASLCDISLRSYRYSMFKIGPVLSVSHGMGIPSLSILLHEIIKLVYHAGCTDVTFIRLGTCGGIGLPGGTLVITEEAVDGLLRPYLELHVLGKTVHRPAVLDQDLVNELKEIAESELPNYKTVSGRTMCTYDFYEGQGRLDGAFCDYSEKEKLSYLSKIHQEGITNIEMESLAFAAMCNHSGVKGAVVCVVLLDRLLGDQVSTPKETLEEWQLRPQQLVAKFMKKRLGIS